MVITDRLEVFGNAASLFLEDVQICRARLNNSRRKSAPTAGTGSSPRNASRNRGIRDMFGSGGRSMNRKGLLLLSALMLAAILVSADTEDQKMIKNLGSKDVQKRRDAAEQLADSKPVEAVPALANALKDTDEDVRSTAAYALWNIASDSYDESDDTEKQANACEPARAALKAALADPSGLVRIYAAGALNVLDEKPATLIAAIKPATTDPRMWVRAYAIENLLEYKVSINSLIPEIQSVFSSTPAGTAKEKTSMGFFAGFLNTENQDPNSAAKELLAKALSKYPQPDGLLPTWIAALEDPVENVRGYAMKILMTYKPVPPAGLKRIREYTKGFSDMDRMNAVEALGSMKSIPPEVVTDLCTAMKDKQEMVRSAAADALGKVKPATKEVVDALILGLRDKKSDVRRDSADALAEIGPAGKDAIPVLQEIMAKDKEWTVQGSAKDALRAMGVKVD